MWKPSEFFSIQTNVERLQTQFRDMENSYYNYLKKAYNDNEKLINEDGKLDPQYFQELLAEQSQLESDLRGLSALGDAHGENIRRLKSLLFDKKPPSSQGEGNEALEELKNTIEASIQSMRGNINSIDDIKELDGTVKLQINSHIDHTVHTTLMAFEQMNAFVKEQLNKVFDDQASMKKVDEIATNNTNLLQNLDSNLDSLKKKVSTHLNEVEQYGVSFVKESQLLKDNFDEIKQHVKIILRETKLDNKVSSPAKLQQDEENFFKTRKSAMIIDQMLDEVVANEVKLSKLHGAAREEFGALAAKTKHHVKEIRATADKIRLQNTHLSKVFKPELGNSNSNQSIPPAFPSEQKKDTRKGRQVVSSSRLTRMSPNKSNSPSAIINTSPGHSNTKPTYLSSSAKKKQIAKTMEYEAQIEHLKGQIDTQLKDYENLVQTYSQKISYLRTSARNLIISATKLANLLPNSNAEEEFSIRLFENDKRGLENYLQSLCDYADQIKHNIPPKAVGQIRSQSHDARGRPQSNRKNSPGIRKNLYSTGKFQDPDENVNYSNKPSGQKIKGLVDDFDRDFSDALKRFDGGQRDSIGMAENSPARSFEGPATSIRSSEMKQLKNELSMVKLRYEKIIAEKSHLEKEVKTLQEKNRSKGSASSSLNYLEQVKELTLKNEQLKQDNAKIAKIAKKFQEKADERKQNIKDMYKLLKEKDKEKDHYRALALNPDSQVERMEEMINQKQGELERNYKRLEEELYSKDRELTKMTQMVERLQKANAAGIHIDDGKRNSTDSNLQDSVITQDDKVEIMNKQLRELDEKKKKLDEAINTIESISPVKAQQLKDMIEQIDNEKMVVQGRIEAIREAALNGLEESPGKKDYRERIADLRTQLKQINFERDQLKEHSLQQEMSMEQLKIEKRELEEKIAELTEDLEDTQSHRKKVEKQYEEQIKILNSKIKELTLYAEDLESKNNLRIREQLQEKQRGESPFKFKSPDTTHNENQESVLDKETIQDLRGEIEAINNKIDNCFLIMQVPKDTYTTLDTYDKTEKLAAIIKEREFEKKKDGGGVNETGLIKRPTRKPSPVRSPQEADIVKKQNIDLEMLLASNKTDIKKLTKDNEDLSHSIAKKDSENQRIKEDIETKTNKIMELSKKFKEAESRCLQFQGDLENFVGKLSEIANKFKFAEVGGSLSGYEVFDMIETKLGEYEKNKRELDMKSSQLENVQKRLRKDFEHNTKLLHDQMTSLEIENQQIRVDLNESQNKIRQKEDELKTLQNQYDLLKSNDEPRRKEIENLKIENRQLQSFVDQFKNQAEEHQNLVATEQELRQKEAVAAKEKTDQIIRDRRKLQHELEQLKAQNKQLTDNLEEMEFRTQKEVEAAQEAANEEWKKKLSEREKKISESRKEMNKKMDDMNTKFWKETEKYNRQLEQYSFRVQELENDQKGKDLQIKALNETIKLKEKEVQDLNNLVDKLVKEKAKLEQDFMDKSREYDSLRIESNSLKGDLKASQSDIEKKNKFLAQDKNRLEYDLKDCQKKLEDTQNELNDAKEKLAKATSDLKSQKNEVQILEKQVQTLRNDLKEAKNTIQALNADIEFHKNTQTATRNQMIQLEDKLASESNRADDVQSKFDKLKNEHQKLKTTENALNSEILRLKKKIGEQQVEIDQINEDRDGLLRSLDEEREKYYSGKQDLNTGNQKLSELNQRLTEKEAELRETKEELDHYKDELSKVSNENLAIIENLEKANDELQERIHKLQTQLEETIEEYKKNANEREGEFTSRIDEYDDRIDQLVKEKDEALERAETFENKLGLAKENQQKIKDEAAHLVQSYEKEIQKSEDKARQYKSEAEEAKEQVERLRGEINDLMQESDQSKVLQTKIQEYETLVEDKNQKIREVETEVVEKDREISDKQYEIEGLLRDLQDQKRKIIEIQEQSKKLGSEYEEALNEANEKVKNLEDEVAQKNSVIDEMNTEIEGYGSRITDMTYNFEDRINEINAKLQKEVENTRKEYESKTKDLKEQLSKAIEERDEIQIELEKIQNSASNRRHQVDDLQERAAESENLVEQMRNERNEGIQNMIKDYEQQIEEYEARINDLQDERNQLVQDNGDYMNQIDELKNDITKSTKKIDQLQKDLEEAQNDKKELEETNFQLRDTLERIKKEEGSNAINDALIAEKQQEIDNLNKYIEELDAQNSELQNQLAQKQQNESFSNEENAQQITKYEDQIRALKKKNDQLDEQNEEYSRAVKKHALKDQENDQYKMNLVNQLDDVTKEKNSLENKVEFLEKEIKELKENGADPSVNVVAIQERNAQLENDIALADNEIARLKEVIHQLETDNEMLSGQNNDLKDEIDMERHQNSQIKEEYERRLALHSASDPDEVQDGSSRNKNKKSVDTLMSENQHYREENQDLRKTVSNLQEQVVILSQQKQQVSSGSFEKIQQQKDEILREKLAAVCKLKSFVGAVNVMTQTPEELEQTLSKIYQILERNEEELDYLQEEVSKYEESNRELKDKADSGKKNQEEEIDQLKITHQGEIDDLQGVIKAVKAEFQRKMQMVGSEVSKIIKYVFKQPPPMRSDIEENEEYSENEKIIMNNLKSVGEFVLSASQDSDRYEKLTNQIYIKDQQINELAHKLSEFENKEKEMTEENETLRVKSAELEERVIQKETETAELKKSIVENQKKQEKGISFDTQEDLDVEEHKVRSFLEESYNVERKEESKDESNKSKYEDQIRGLMDRVRELEDENQKMEDERKNAKNDYELAQFQNQELRSEIKDLEDNAERMDFQMKVIKDEYKKIQEQKSNSIDHEKEALRKMFVSFMESSLEKKSGEAEAMLMTFLNLLGFGETDRKTVLEGFKAKSVKKGTFSKVFKK